jgi:glycogen synthase
VDLDADPRKGNGFLFRPYEPTRLLDAVRRAVKLYRRTEHREGLARRVMKLDFSWGRSAEAYEAAFARLASGARGAAPKRKRPAARAAGRR